MLWEGGMLELALGCDMLVLVLGVWDMLVLVLRLCSKMAPVSVFCSDNVWASWYSGLACSWDSM